MKITNNVISLTDSEKDILKTAKYFNFVYDVGLILFTDKDNKPGSWDCSNSVAAKEYLTKLGIREI